MRIHVERRGEGPEVLLVHGGASPAATWKGLEPLASCWTLAYAYRRGFPPSPPGDGDFARDAADLEPLLRSRPHLVAHSYGGLGTLIAAGRHPDLVSSLTLIEVPVYRLLPGDPEVEHLERIGDEAIRRGLDADPAELREFLRLAGAEGVDEGPLPESVAAGVRRAQGTRPPGDADPPLAQVRDAAFPVLVASGGHSTVLERLADRLASELASERIVVPGAGHFVAAAPGFAERLATFLTLAPTLARIELTAVRIRRGSEVSR